MKAKDDITGVTPDTETEYCRIYDLDRRFGIRRGTAYNLLTSGAIKGKLLRVTGQASGIRLIDVASVRALIESSNHEVKPTAQV